MVIEIIKLIKKTTNLHVHCKVNLYQDEDDSVEICKILAENGADSLQITRFLSPQYFRKGQDNQDMLVGFADRVAGCVDIPVVLGGGRSDMDKVLSECFHWNYSKQNFFSEYPIVKSLIILL